MARQQLFVTTLTENKPSKLGMMVVGGLVFFQWVLVAVYFWQLPPEIPLYFCLPLGLAQLAPKHWFVLVPGLTTVFVLVNALMVKLNLRLHQIFWQIIVWVTALESFLGLVALVNILFLVY